MAKRGRPKHPDILTPREWEVLALLREGLSNDQIAGRLDITERTAKYHVAEILGKLGVSSRQEAAAWEPDAGERRPWWQRALVPAVLSWPKLPLGWLAPAAAGVTAVAVAAGIALLVWGLVRTNGDGDGLVAVLEPTPTLTPVDPATVDPPDELVWMRDGAVALKSVHPATCGDADTAEAYGVPMALDIPVDARQFPAQEVSPWMLGLEAEPYEYVPAQVVATGSLPPMGWEASTRSRFALNIPLGPARPGPFELFLRRLDQPSVLFRYSTQNCEPTTTAIIEPSRMVIPPEPEIVVHREGDYLSFDEAAELALVEPPVPASARIVMAELGNFADFNAPRDVIYPSGDYSDPDRVVWSFLFVVGDEAGPQRPGQATGIDVIIDAATGDFVSAGCCVDLVMPP